MSAATTLGKLRKGQAATIRSVGHGSHGSREQEVIQRLLEMGFLEGARVEIALEAPVSLDPIAVKVRGAIIALRRSEANLIEVDC